MHNPRYQKILKTKIELHVRVEPGTLSCFETSGT